MLYRPLRRPEAEAADAALKDVAVLNETTRSAVVKSTLSLGVTTASFKSDEGLCLWAGCFLDHHAGVGKKSLK